MRSMKHSAFGLVTIAFLLMVSTAIAQVGAVVENIHYERDNTIAKVRIVNNSVKNITAFNLTVDVTFANGARDHFERMVDLLPLMLSKATASGATTLSEGGIGQGERYEETLTFQPGGPPLSNVDASLDMVVYSDRSADVRNERALSSLEETRKGRALAAQRAVDIINNVMANPADPNPRETAIRQLRTALEESKRNHGGELDVEFLSTISDLQNGLKAPQSKSEDKQRLSDYAHTKTATADSASLHSKIARTK